MADRELTEDEVADLKEAFAMFDINGDGACRICTPVCCSNRGSPGVADETRQGCPCGVRDGLLRSP